MSRIERIASMTSSSVSQTSAPTTTGVPGSIVSRCGLIFNPPTLLIEYQHNKSERVSDVMLDGMDHSSAIHCKQIRIRRNTGPGCKNLLMRYPALDLHRHKDQLKGILDRLVEQLTISERRGSANNKKVDVDNSSSRTSTVQFQRQKGPVDEKDLLAMDLNKCSDNILSKAKSIMDREFEANRLRPGDEGYVWEVSVEFDSPREATDWDEED